MKSQDSGVSVGAVEPAKQVKAAEPVGSVGSEQGRAAQSKSGWGLYEWSVIGFCIIVPLVGTVVEMALVGFDWRRLAAVALAWWVFGCVGLRLGSAGVKQAVTPSFTARELLGIQDDSANHVVRELGFANSCFGLLGVLSLFLPVFRLPALVGGGLYLALAGIQHVVRYARRSAAAGELFPMVSDILICLWLVLLLVLAVV